jgi:hypothetical protein
MDAWGVRSWLSCQFFFLFLGIVYAPFSMPLSALYHVIFVYFCMQVLTLTMAQKIK